jgi:phospholipid/cholesterol/gamma-HCH transport system substrate-binding protein
MMRLARAAAAAAAAALALSACDASVSGMPLPGGPDVGDDSYSVSIEFRDVLDLVPQSVVKVDDVSVGKVEDITLDGWTANVTVRINGAVDLPENAVASIQQTSLLGEKYIALSSPADEPATGRLEDGDTIPLSRSGRNPEVEEVLGALSLLLNGGGVAQLKTISTELNSALSGNESDIRSVLGQLDTFMGQLDENKSQVIAAIRSMNALSLEVKDQQQSIIDTVDQLPAALKVLDDQRAGLVRMLQGLKRLSPVATRVIRASKQSTLADLRALDPILTKLAAAGDAVPKSFEVLLTYPFPNAAVGSTPEEAQNLHQGDYTNLSAEIDIDLGALPTIGLPPIPRLPVPGLPTPPTLPAPTAPSIPVPTLPRIPIPGLPSLPIPTLGVPTLGLPTLSLPTISIPGLPPITLLRGQTVTIPGGPTIDVPKNLDGKAAHRLAKRLLALGADRSDLCALPSACSSADLRRAAEYAAHGYDEDLALLLLQGVSP